ncbi:hypothetical protein AB0I10_05460 [Streptomyces sp. NPDC050636]|uniref:hypothetical protein n=1 Tax=Streptomyces sp. NPDC050636 TaxID=3154510 RepID=UPI00343D1508
MRKFQQVAIVVAAVAGLSTLGAGVSFAHGHNGGPQVTAWATSQSAAEATAQGANNNWHPHAAAPEAYVPQAAPQVAAPQAAPQPAPQPVAPQAAPQPAPQPAPQAVAPQAAPQPAPQMAAPQAAPQPAPQPAAPQPAPEPAPQAAPQAAPQEEAPQESSEDRHKGKDKGKDIDVSQHTQCRSHDLNLNVLGEVGLLNGVLGNALNGEGDSGAQRTHQGSTMGCNNSALSK